MINNIIGSKVIAIPMTVGQYSVIVYALERHLREVKIDLLYSASDTKQEKRDRIKVIEEILGIVNGFDIVNCEEVVL